MSYHDISVLKGLTITGIRGMKSDQDEIYFVTECGRSFRMLHHQDCCERVYLEDVVGDVNDLIGSPVLVAEESSSEIPPDEDNREYFQDLQRWTYYKLATIKGYVDLRWYGSSNGYYSVGVSFEEV